MNLQINEHYYISDIAPSDKASFVEHLKEKEIYLQTMGIPFPYTSADADIWIKKNQDITVKNGGRSVNWAIRKASDNQLIGCVGYYNYNIGESHTAEVGYWLAKPYWNKGIMSAAVKKVCEYGFKEFGIHRIQAHTSSNNPSSEKVLLKSGFQYEGLLRGNKKKDGQFIDSKIFSLLVTDPG